MIRETRGNQIIFTEIFYDSNDNVATVGSATVTVVYPSSTASNALLRRDPGQLKGKETLVMIQDDDGAWNVTWDSSVADPGVVYWNIASSEPTINKKGSFVLEGNLANLEAF